MVYWKRKRLRLIEVNEFKILTMKFSWKYMSVLKRGHPHNKEKNEWIENQKNAKLNTLLTIII